MCCNAHLVAIAQRYGRAHPALYGQGLSLSLGRFTEFPERLWYLADVVVRFQLVSVLAAVSPIGLRSWGSKVTPSVDFTTNDRLNQATGTSGTDRQSPGCVQQPGYSSLKSLERAAENSLKSNGTGRADPLQVMDRTITN